jgi:hypothetical protein
MLLTAYLAKNGTLSLHDTSSVIGLACCPSSMHARPAELRLCCSLGVAAGASAS